MLRGLKLSSVAQRKNMPLLFFLFFFIYCWYTKSKRRRPLIHSWSKLQRLIILLINRPFKIILNDYDFNQAGVIIIIALFCTACDSCTDCFHTLAMSIDDTSHDVS